MRSSCSHHVNRRFPRYGGKLPELPGRGYHAEEDLFHQEPRRNQDGSGFPIDTRCIQGVFSQCENRRAYATKNKSEQNLIEPVQPMVVAVVNRGTEGHQVVAVLAQAQLTPKARTEVNRLFALEPGEALLSISTWADEHRNPATAPWHYVNLLRDSCTYGAERDCACARCVVAAIDHELAIQSSKSADEKRPAALKYGKQTIAKPRRAQVDCSKSVT